MGTQIYKYNFFLRGDCLIMRVVISFISPYLLGAGWGVIFFLIFYIFLSVGAIKVFGWGYIADRLDTGTFGKTTGWPVKHGRVFLVPC